MAAMRGMHGRKNGARQAAGVGGDAALVKISIAEAACIKVA